MAAFKGEFVFISEQERLPEPLFIAHSGVHFKPKFHIVPCRISDVPTSVAGEGAFGPPGPRTGNSSGICPGNSSGRGGSPGSRIGGGTSGRGSPGGSSCGGSVGWPGVGGGISGGSIPIYIVTLRLSPRSGRVPVTAAAPIFT